MRTDLPHRKFRFIEVRDPKELKRSRSDFPLVEGWLDVAERLSPNTPKALLEGDYVARLSDGTLFKEVSFKTAQPAVEQALGSWSHACGRRWARIIGDEFVVSDGLRLPAEWISFESVDGFE